MITKKVAIGDNITMTIDSDKSFFVEGCSEQEYLEELSKYIRTSDEKHGTYRVVYKDDSKVVISVSLVKEFEDVVSEKYTQNNIIPPSIYSIAEFDEPSKISITGNDTFCLDEIAVAYLRGDYIPALYNSNNCHIKVSDFIEALKELVARYGDGYIRNGSNEYTSEISFIDIKREKINNNDFNTFFDIV